MRQVRSCFGSLAKTETAQGLIESRGAQRHKVEFTQHAEGSFALEVCDKSDHALGAWPRRKQREDCLSPRARSAMVEFRSARLGQADNDLSQASEANLPPTILHEFRKRPRLGLEDHDDAFVSRGICEGFSLTKRCEEAITSRITILRPGLPTTKRLSMDGQSRYKIHSK